MLASNKLKQVLAIFYKNKYNSESQARIMKPLKTQLERINKVERTRKNDPKNNLIIDIMIGWEILSIFIKYQGTTY